jgi:hypothetical protein
MRSCDGLSRESIFLSLFCVLFLRCSVINNAKSEGRSPPILLLWETELDRKKQEISHFFFFVSCYYFLLSSILSSDLLVTKSSENGKNALLYKQYSLSLSWHTDKIIFFSAEGREIEDRRRAKEKKHKSTTYVVKRARPNNSHRHTKEERKKVIQVDSCD